MTPFLKAVANAYSSRYADLSGFCFLFPNKRSGTFFLKYLREGNNRHVVLAPEITSIPEFVSKLSNRAIASHLDLLFLLYESYLEVLGLKEGESETVDFDSFRLWGETVLSDFNDIDLHLATPGEIFKNVKDFREISSNFLNEQQQKVINEYFGQYSQRDPLSFWRNFDGNEEMLSPSKRKFLHLWRIMGPLYNSLHKRLEKEHLSTAGGAYRLAYEKLRDIPCGGLPYQKIVVVGFNALSASERGIFECLRNAYTPDGTEPFADFFWDATGPILSNNSNSASKFVRSNMKSFPSPEWARNALRKSDTERLPQKLDIIASPSNSAQTKIAGELLAELMHKLDSSDFKEAKVAVVLPDESLLMPMLYSLPAGLENVNLTMGYPLKMTMVVPFIANLRNLLRGRKDAKGTITFHSKELRDFICHPYMRILLGEEESSAVINELDKRTSFRVDINAFCCHSAVLATLLKSYNPCSPPAEIVGFADSLLKSVADAIRGNKVSITHRRLELSHIDKYRESTCRLKSLLGRYSFKMSASTVFRLLDRLVSQQKVGLEGEPLSGLQIMGTLETRSIDFSHIIILSVNERIMPMRRRARTFIPDTLRRAYGIPPSNYAESVFSYYFYRMISRAKEVSVVYDARSASGGKTSGMSRYLYQLHNIFAKDEANWKSWKFRLVPKRDFNPTILKTGFIPGEIAKFAIKGSGRNFSASSLNVYRECQVKFFYRHILNIDTDPAPSEFIDAIKAGNIVHKILLDIYLPDGLQGKLLDIPVVITKKRIEEVLDNTDNLWKRMTRVVNKLHHRLGDDELDNELPNASRLVAETLMEQIVNVLRHDLKLTPFRMYGGEVTKKIQVATKSGRMVNFNFAIDRLDEIDTPQGPRLRIVDYKTGRTKLTAETAEAVFESGYKQEQIFQLFTYAWLLNGQNSPMLPTNPLVEIYNVADIHKSGTHIPVIGGVETAEYICFADGFDDGISNMIDSVFDDEAFLPVADKETCQMCSLHNLCRR